MWQPAVKPGEADLDALRAFGKGQTVAGPFTQTAAGQSGCTGGDPAAAASGGWTGAHAPHAAGQAVQLGAQAKMVSSTLREFQAQAATDVYWSWHFWERVAAVDGLHGLHPDIRRLLLCHGYVGAGTKSPPGPGLPQELEMLMSSAAPPHGAGLQGAPGWTWSAPSPAQQEEARWNLSLPPDLKRAAPEIYRSMRGAGAASARDWLSQEVTGQRHTAIWTDLWTAATNVDYLLGGCRTQTEVLTKLASDDALELHLRRLASYVYELRTKDKVGAAAMLAVRPPGSATDLAPTWLVSEATAHSKSEFQRDERVASAGKREGRGGGRGGGFGGGAGGGGDAAGGGRGRGADGGGRGRGRGGRAQGRGRPQA